jgi:putative ABC transport system permease protein
MNYVSLTPADLLIASALLIINGLISWRFRLGLERSIAVAALRMVVQLSLIALLLKFIFAQENAFWTFAFAIVMVVAAGIEVVSRQHRAGDRWAVFGFSTTTLLFIGTVITVLGVGVIISPEPWYAPRYVLPILGMVLGNSMTAIALVLDGIGEAATRERAVIEARLALGAPRFEAFGGPVRAALRTGMMPMLNAMATTGIVAIPGMMTGQIIAGADPVGAAKYQMLILLLIAGATALGSLIAAVGAVWMFTDDRHRLRPPRPAAK